MHRLATGLAKQHNEKIDYITQDNQVCETVKNTFLRICALLPQCTVVPCNLYMSHTVVSCQFFARPARKISVVVQVEFLGGRVCSYYESLEGGIVF